MDAWGQDKRQPGLKCHLGFPRLAAPLVQGLSGLDVALASWEASVGLSKELSCHCFNPCKPAASPAFPNKCAFAVKKIVSFKEGRKKRKNKKNFELECG